MCPPAAVPYRRALFAGRFMVAAGPFLVDSVSVIIARIFSAAEPFLVVFFAAGRFMVAAGRFLAAEGCAVAGGCMLAGPLRGSTAAWLDISSGSASSSSPRI